MQPEFHHGLSRLARYAARAIRVQNSRVGPHNGLTATTTATLAACYRVSDVDTRDDLVRGGPIVVHLVVSPQPRSLARALRPAGRRDVLQPTDRASTPDRVLRRPSSRVQLQHAREKRAGTAEHRRAARTI